MNAGRVVVTVAMVVCCSAIAMGQTEWTHDLDNPVINPGEPGEWDEGVREPMAVVIVESTYHMWFAGSGPNDTEWKIGHATSSDGLDWIMDPANPVLPSGAAGEWDEGGIWAASVIHDGAQFHIWYEGWGGSSDPVGIGYATSPDGSAWTKHAGNPVMDAGPAGSWDDAELRPTAVILQDGIYKMWFAAFTTNEGFQWGGRVGYAESIDGVWWTKHLEPVFEAVAYPGSWDVHVAANPFVVFDGSVYHMWYTGGADITGGYNDIGYAFSTDGIQWSRHHENPVVDFPVSYTYLSPVVFDGTTFHMWYPHWDGGAAERIYHATSDCCAGVAGMSHSQFIPAAAVASGAQGAFFQTDVDLSNAGSQPVQYQFMWLPRGVDNSDPTTSETFSLGANIGIRYENVLTEVFDLEPNALGALMLVSSSQHLLAASRTYNMPGEDGAGTFGQAIPAIESEDFVATGTRKRILFASETDAMRTNVGCQNGSFQFSEVSVDLYDADGNRLARESLDLPPWGNDQLNRVFEDFAPVNGYVEVSTGVGPKNFFCYGSVLDNVTSDPTTILPQ